MCSPFETKKQSLLSGCDLSRKGYIDAEALSVVELLNNSVFYCTTSSCSGRAVIFEWTNADGGMQKHLCDWLMVAHEAITVDQVKEAISRSRGDAAIRFEPYILHVSCETLKRARFLHTAALEAGFKNSGLTLSKRGSIILAVRCTLFLEVPLTRKGKVLVSEEYIEHLVDIINGKFVANSEHAQKLFAKIESILKD